MLRILMLLVLLWPSLAVAQEPDIQHVLHLSDGTVLPGLILEETETTVTLQHAHLGKLVVDRAAIERIEYLSDTDARPNWYTDPARNSILFTPTPATLPKGTGYFRSIELFLMNFGYAPTDWLNLAVGTTFPISSDFIGIMAGAKLRLLDRDDFPVGLAVTGSYTYFDDLQDDALWTTGAVAGIGNDRMSLNVSLGGTFSGSEGEGVFLVGADTQVSRRTKVIVEYGNVTSALFEDEDFNGLMNIGMRFFGESMSFTLTGFRPLQDTGSFIFFPLAVFSFNF